jgi:phytoene dehydrogenase-like protein
MAGLRHQCLQGSVEALFRAPETTTLQALQSRGFTPSMIDRFFRPFFGGVFLEPELNTSSRMFHFLFRMFSLGSACLPAEGMQAIPRQLAAGLPAESLRLGARAEAVKPGLVRLTSGEELRARAVVVATEGPSAARLLGADLSSDGCGVSCLYFAAAHPPFAEPLLALNGAGGPINNLSVPTQVAPTYGPDGESLISVTVLGVERGADRLEADARTQLAEWFGEAVRGWRLLRVYRIPYALPSQAPPALAEPERPVRLRPGVYVCGDHRDTASIQGAMASGGRAAAAVLRDLE